MSTLAHRHLPPQITDRLLAALLPDQVADAARGLGRACEVCGQLLEQAERAQADFLARHPPDRCARDLLARATPMVPPARVSRRSTLIRLAPAALAAAAALVMIAVSRDLAPEDMAVTPEAQIGGHLAIAADLPVLASAAAAGPTGDPSVGFSVYRAGAPVRPGSNGESLRPGDVLELHLQAGRFRAAHVFALDAAGNVRALFDWSPSGGGPPPTFTLDGHPGLQRIVVLFHELPDPLPQLARLRDAVARTYAGAVDTTEAAAPWRPVDGHEIVTGSILVRQEAAP
jgi:hypothetical protein